MTKVINLLRREPYDIYIGRAGHGKDGYFGNPFQIGIDGTREEVIEKFRVYFYDRVANDQEFNRRLMALEGKTLGCFCKPATCHGDIIAEYVDSY